MGAASRTCGRQFIDLLFTSDMPFVTSSLAGFSRAATAILKPYARVSKLAEAVIGGTQLTTLWTLPIDVIGLINSISRIVFSDTKEERLDGLLDLTGKIGHIGDGIGNLTAGLADIGAVASRVMVWAGPLSLACSLAGVVMYVINGKAIHNNRKFLRAFKACKNPQDVLGLVKNKKQIYRLDKNAGVDVSLFTKKIKRLQNIQSTEANTKILKTYKALKTRIKWKQVSHALGMLITTIGIVASIILFVSTAHAWVIAGSSLLLVLYLIAVSKMGMDFWANRQFKRAMRLA